MARPSDSKSSPHLSDSVARAPKVMERQVGDAGVLLDLTSGRYFELNATGRRVWELLGEGSDLGRVLDRLVDEFDAPRQELEADLLELVERLSAEGLLRRDARPEAGEP